jgi:hypothetical protein
LQQAGVFPPPERDETGRPYYPEELQSVCLEVRRRNCGANGKPVLFYARRVPPSRATTRQPKAPMPKTDQYAELIEALRGLGLPGVTAAQVGAAVEELYPQGRSGVAEAEVIRAVFLHLKRRDSGGNVGK